MDYRLRQQTDPAVGTYYRITVKGMFRQPLPPSLTGLTRQHAENTTTFSGYIHNRAMLRHFFVHVHQLGLPILAIQSIKTLH